MDSSGPAGAKYPVVNVGRYEAAACARWAGSGLAAEAEWEKAARGTGTRIYPWGDQWDVDTGNVSRLNFCDKLCPDGADRESWRDNIAEDGQSQIGPVGQYQDGRSFYGVLNMAGNVREWVDEWYEAYPGSSLWLAEFGQKRRVTRGGSWDLDRRKSRCAWREGQDPGYGYPVVGFRVAQSQ